MRNWWFGISLSYLLNICIYTLFLSNTFISNSRLKLAKNQANAKRHPEAELLVFESYSHSLYTLSSKNNRTSLKKQAKEQVGLLNEIIRLIIMKMKKKKKNRSHRYDINRPRSRLGHKYSKYKTSLIMVMHICIKQHLSNIWNSIHQKVKQHWCWVEKNCC